MYRLPGGSKSSPLDEAALTGGTLLKAFQREEEHPFTSKKGFVIPALHLSDFEICDSSGAPRELLRTMPEGTLRSAEKAAKKAHGNDETRASAALEKLNVYVRARLMPSGGAAAATRVRQRRWRQGLPLLQLC